MLHAAMRAIRLTTAPDAEWRCIAREVQRPGRVLSEFVLPLSFIPATCWSLNLFLNGVSRGIGRETSPAEGAQIIIGGLNAYAGTVLSILMLAAAAFVLAPLFARARDWPSSLVVASYSFAPMLLAGALLTIPELALALVLAGFQSMYLMYCGARRILEIRNDQAAEYVALCIVLLIVASTILGAAGSWLGVL